MTKELLTTLQTGDVLSVEYPNVYIERAAPAPESIVIAYITDPHVGRAGTYTPGEFAGITSHIVNAHNPDFFIVNGDIVDAGLPTQFQEYLTSWPSESPPRYQTPGNHDENGDGDDPPPNDLTNYDFFIGGRHWATTAGNYRLIGVTALIKRDEPFLGFFYLEQGTRDFIANEAANLNGRKPILFLHPPVHDGFGNNLRDYPGNGTISGQADVFDLFSVAGGGLLFSGHRHMGKALHTSEVVTGLTEVQGPCLAYNQNDPNGGYLILTVQPSAVQIDHYLGRSPFTHLGTDIL